ncbi:MAG: CHASE domain-containing protein, partial [Verrucomicrobia bacterium]|nr:CHASE domain-containing protein [Verrucomicrobiota bacterium]
MNVAETESHSISAPRGRPYMMLALTVCCGLVLSVSACAYLRHRESQKAQSEFSHAAEHRVALLGLQIATNLNELESLAAFFAGSQKVERTEFRAFVEPFLSHGPPVRCLEWIPRVPHSLRMEYEEAVRQEGFPEFQMTERKKSGRRVKATRREEYFPVHYVEPYEGNESALGYDLSSNATRLQALHKARDTGAPVATAGITLVQETGDQIGFLVAVPVYRKNASTDYVEDRRRNLEGFALGVFRVGDLVDRTLSYVDPEGIDIHIFDNLCLAGQRLLHFHSSRTRSSLAKPMTEEAALRTGLHAALTLDLVGREWLVICTPTRDRSVAGKTWQPWVILTCGLVLTGLLAGYIRNSSARTTNVAAANARLRKEVDDRRRTEEKLSRIQMAVDDATDAILIVDNGGKVSYTNVAFADMFAHTLDTINQDGWESIYVDSTITKEIMHAIMCMDNWTGEIEMVSRRGSRFMAAVRATPISGVSASSIGIMLFIDDISARREAEIQLRVAHAEIKHVFSSISSALIAVDDDDRIRHWNKAAERMFGIPTTKAVGRNYRECGIQWDWPVILKGVD